MRILAWIAYAAWIIACLLLFVAFDANEYSLIPIAISLAISGVLFFAFERVVSLLTEIRDAVRPKQPAKTTGPSEASTPIRSVEEISADLDRLKSKQTT